MSKQEAKRTTERPDMEAQVEAQAQETQGEQDVQQAGKLDQRRSKMPFTGIMDKPTG